MKGATTTSLWSSIPRSIPKAGRVADRARARLDRPSIDRDDCAAVLSHYDLRVSRGPRNIGHGWRNDIVTVRTTDGTKVLKRYPSRWNVAAIEHEHSILLWLEQVEFPAVRLARRPNGDTWTTLAGNVYVLFEFSRGRNVTGCIMASARRRSHLTVAGQTLARLHRAMERFVPGGAHHLSRDSAIDDRGITVRHRTALARLVDQPDPPSGDAGPILQALRAEAGRIQERLEQLDESLHAAPLSRHVIHGDFGLHNLLFRADGTAVVHDFELARVDYRLIDIAAVLSRGEIEPMQAFLEGYRSEAAISSHEWECLAEVWEMYRLCGAVQSWENYVRYGDPRRLRTASRRIDEAATVRTRGVLTCL